jgi:hypothetical protein
MSNLMLFLFFSSPFSLEGRVWNQLCVSNMAGHERRMCKFQWKKMVERDINGSGKGCKLEKDVSIPTKKRDIQMHFHLEMRYS